MDTAAPPQQKHLEHGGDLDSARTRFGEPADGWIDLSTGINPNAYPVPDLPSEAWHRLPECRAMDGLIHAARACYGINRHMGVVATPGTQAIIQWLPMLAPSARVAVIAPTYGEHAHTWRSCGHTVTEVFSLSAIPDDCSVAVVVNPNNPDGRTYDTNDLLSVVDAMHARGGFLVVDEAFCDVTPDLSLTPQHRSDGLIILKSFGKFFGLAGIRLGFAIGDPLRVTRLAQHLGPWAVSGPALVIGTQALSDKKWIRETRAALQQDRLRLAAMMDTCDIQICGSTDLFTLVETEHAKHLYEHLCGAGILTRSYAAYTEWIRFGLPGNAQHWARLEAAFIAYARNAKT